jgi:hypothetical protein
MNFDALSMVKFGDVDSLKAFIFENGVQHKTFAETLADQGTLITRFPIMDADPSDLEDWLLAHQVEHQGFAAALGLSNPINLLDSNWNHEADFYDWISTHLSIHIQINEALGL